MAKNLQPIGASTMRTLVVRQSKWSSDPAEQLEEFRHELSKQAVTDSSSRSASSVPSPSSFQLHMLVVDITPRVLNALVDLLNVALPAAITDKNEIDKQKKKNEIDKQKKKNHKWHSVYLRQCRILQRPNPSTRSQHSTKTTSSNNTPSQTTTFSLGDITHLGTSLASRTSALILEECPEVLDCILNHVSRLETTKLSIQRRRGLTEQQCLRLGALIRKSRHGGLKEVHLDSTVLLEAPDRFAVGIATATHLEVLSLVGTLGQGQARSQRRRQGLADLVVSRAGKGEYGYGAVARLLQDPSSRLKALNLSNLGLEEDHLVEISKLLIRPSCPLQELNLSFNDIRAEGILEFAARYLPHMKTLKKISLRPNSWDDFSHKSHDCGAALLEGMRTNTSIAYLDSLVGVPQAPLLRYYANLNRAGRRILSSSTQPVPLGLWSLLLERAGTMTTDDYYSSTSSSGGAVTSKRGDHSAVYFLLQNSPVIAYDRVHQY
jgi:hypothetical protein